MKINFPNAHSVYMHDTPGQSLFGRNFRAASSGCVRIGGIEKLAAWLVAEQGWRPEHVKQMKETGERRDVTLKTPVPLYFVYITAWATEDGVVQFRRDIYQKDGVGPRPQPTDTTSVLLPEAEACGRRSGTCPARVWAPRVRQTGGLRRPFPPLE